MDIKNVMPTAEVEFTLDRKDDEGKPVTVKFSVAFVTADEIMDFVEAGKRFRFSKAVREMLIDAVQDWDLTEKGKPIVCNDETKRRILPVLFGDALSDDRPEAERTDKDGNAVPHPDPMSLILGRRLFLFAVDEENFLKN